MFYKGQSEFLPRHCPLYLFSKMSLKFCLGIVTVHYRLSLINHTKCNYIITYYFSLVSCGRYHGAVGKALDYERREQGSNPGLGSHSTSFFN